VSNQLLLFLLAAFAAAFAAAFVAAFAAACGVAFRCFKAVATSARELKRRSQRRGRPSKPQIIAPAS